MQFMAAVLVPPSAQMLAEEDNQMIDSSSNGSDIKPINLPLCQQILYQKITGSS